MQAVSTRSADRNNFLRYNEIWQDFFKKFTQYNHCFHKLKEWSPPALHDLLLQLSTKNKYKKALVKSENEKIEHHHLVTPLFKNKYIKSSLITLSPYYSLPLHDHPCSTGASIVIKGSALLFEYDLVNPQNNTPLSRCILKLTNIKNLTSNDTTCFTKTTNNIHQFKVTSKRLTLLVIHCPRINTLQQSYFFVPSEPKKIGLQILAQRFQTKNIQALSTYTA